MKYQTTWHDALQGYDALPPLRESTATNTCIIGGGIAGTTIAYMLAKAGKQVIVIDKDTLGDSVTVCTTAFLTSTIDTDLTDLVKMYGKKETKLIINSHEDAIDMIERIITEEKIDCDFMRVSSYEVALSDKGFEQLKDDAKISNSIGHEVTVSPSVTLPFSYVGITESKDQAKFHPIKYVRELRARAINYGAKFYEHSEALSYSGEHPVKVCLKDDIVITAKHLVIATYNPFKQPWWYVFKKGTYVSYVYEIAIDKDLFPEALFEDDDNPYFYYRIDKGDGKDRMIIGGADHRHELPISDKDGFQTLDRYITETLGIKKYEVIRKWNGPILEQTDGLAYIGQVKKDTDTQFVATGFSGNGMTYGTLSGMIISDLILDTKNPYAHLYRPYRGISFQDVMRKGRDYMDELFRGVAKLVRSRAER